jgi:hypothetical protein
MMNQIIGNRLNTDVNQSNPTTEGKLFAVGLSDQILNQIQFQQTAAAVVDGAAEGTEDPQEEAEKNLEEFFSKTGIYPKVSLEPDAVTSDFDNEAYFISFEDKELFNAYKNKSDKVSADNVSIAFPIKFTFTVHGISGIKRGDKFVINGIPDKYGKDNGFFQVLSVKHVVEGMMWKTTVEGGFRQSRQK